MMSTTASELLRSPLEALERTYCEAPARAAPARRFRGAAICRVGNPRARSLAASAIVWPFEHLPFWVDFVTCTWAFEHPRVRAGRFRVDPGRSRWRDTDALRLRYDVSRLPFRRLLYDEVKPLTESVCLGIGGINQDRGAGDLFFFVLDAQ